MRHGGRADRVFEHQVPADDPGEELAQRGVGVGVGGSGDGDHRGELGVAERGEDARDARDDEGEHQRRAGGVVRRLADQHEDARSDDRTDPEAGEPNRAEDASETVLSLLLLQKHA